MNKISKSLIVLFLAFLLGGCFGVYSVQAQDDKLVFEVIQGCDIQYAGDNCVAELKLTNNTGEILDGTAILDIDYQGICGNSFEIGGIDIWYDGQISKMQWNGDRFVFIGFSIVKGETQPKLKIETVSNLCPGNYAFTLTLKGTAETGEEYIATPTIVGGGGGGYYAPLTIPTTDTGRVIATPGEGGKTTLTNPDGSQIKLIIPEGAIPTNTSFIIERVDISSVSQPETSRGLFLIAGLVYEIKAQIGEELITTFSKPLSLDFIYTDKQVEGLDENSLKIYWWNGEEWVALENSEVNIDNNIATALIDHFTLFALMGSEIEFIGEEEEEIKEEVEKEDEEEKEILPEGEAEEDIGEEKEEKVEEEEIVSDGVLQKGLAFLLATIGMPWGENNKSVLLTVVIFLCLAELAFIGTKKWRLSHKKRKK